MARVGRSGSYSIEVRTGDAASCHKFRACRERSWPIVTDEERDHG